METLTRKVAEESKSIENNEKVIKSFGEHKEAKLIRLGIDTPLGFGEAIGNFAPVMSTATKIAGGCHDYTAIGKDLQIIFEDEMLKLWDKNTNRALPFSRWSLSQFCEKNELPAGFIKKCLAKGMPELAVTNMNRFVETHPRAEYQLREFDGRIRGIVSPKYSKFDNKEVLESLYDTIGQEFNYKIANSFLDEERMNIRVIQNEQLPIQGEDLFAGFQIKNSDVGKSSLEIQVLLYKFICSNGMILGGGRGMYYSRKHIAIGKEHFIEEVQEMLRALPDTIQFIKDKVEASKERLNSATMQKYIDEFKTKMKATDELVEKVKETVEKYGQSRWGIANAITEVSQEYSLDRREELDTYAGRLIA